MNEQKKYDVVFPCGAAIRGVNDRVPVGTAITVWVCPASGGMQPTDDNGEAAPCAFCRRKRGRKEEMFYTEGDQANGTRPQGRWITCRVCGVRERRVMHPSNVMAAIGQENSHADGDALPQSDGA